MMFQQPHDQFSKQFLSELFVRGLSQSQLCMNFTRKAVMLIFTFNRLMLHSKRIKIVVL